MSSRKESPAPKRATIANSRGLPPVRISNERIVSDGRLWPDTACHRTAHSLVSRGCSVRVRNKSYSAWSG